VSRSVTDMAPSMRRDDHGHPQEGRRAARSGWV